MLFKTTNFLSDKIWVVVTLIIVFVTVYTVLGRQLIERVPEYRTQLEELIEKRSGIDVQIDDMRGKWTLFTPVVELSKVAVVQPLTGEVIFSARKISLEIDVLSSLAVRELRMRRVVMTGFSAILEDELLKLSDDKSNIVVDELEEASSQKKNLADEEKKINNKSSLMNIALAHEIFRQRNIQLQDSTITFQKRGKPARVLTNINAQFQNIAGKHTLSGKVHLEAGRQLFEFSANANGFPLDENTKINIYGNLHHGNVLSWLPEDIQDKLILKGFKINSLLLNSQLWVTWHKGYFKNIIGKVNAEEIGLVNNSSPETGKKTSSIIQQVTIPPFNNVSVLYSVAPIKPQSFKHGFKVTLSDLKFEWDDFIWEKSNFLIDVDLPSEIDPLKLSINASEIDLKPLANFLLVSNSLPKETRDIINSLEPSGKIKDIRFKYNAFNKIKYKLEARLKNIAVKEWGRLPGISNLSADLSMTNRAGYLQLNTRNTLFETSRYLRQPINVSRLTGPVKWEITKKGNKKTSISVQSGILALENNDVKGKLMLSFTTPDEEPFPLLTLIADINKAPAEKISFYLPPIIPKGALDWLDNGILSGNAKGAIVYHGPVGAGSMTNYNHSLQSLVFVNSANIDFDPGKWPEIKNSSGNIFIHNNLVDFDFSRGNIFNASASNIIGHIGPSGKDSIWQLELSGHISGSTSDGLRVLKESILKETLNDVASEWIGKGKLETHLELTIPFEGVDVNNSQVNVDIILKQSGINMSDFDLVFSDINGTMNYSTEVGLTSSSLKAKLFSNSAIVDIMPINKINHELFSVSIKSKVDALTLYKWSKQPLIAFMEGETAYKADLKVFNKPNEDTYTELAVNSNLAGLEINMPSVFNKSREIISPLLFNMKWKGDDTYLILGRQNVFNSLLMFNNNELIKGELVIGNRLATMPDDKRLYAEGFLEKIMWLEWEQFFDALEKEYQQMDLAENNYNQKKNTDDEMGEFLNSIGEINLKMDYFEGFGMELDNVVSKITRDGPAWRVQSKNEILSGKVKVPDGDEPLDIKLDYLHLPDEEAPHMSISDYKPMVGESPLEFPAVNVSINDFKYGIKDFGSWKVIAYPSEPFYRIESLKIQIGDLSFKGQGQWVYGEPYSKTTMTGEVSTRDVGDLMKSWGYPATIESKSGQMTYDISWPYSPVDFDTDFLEGIVQLKLKNGRFLEVEGAASAVRVMGILNFSTLGRRLKLNFTDLYKSGLSYDRIKGPISFKNGNVFFRKFEIKGPSTYIEARGSLDYINEKVDMNLEVSLPFSKNMIPLVAIVAGPLAGGGWFVADRLFGDKLNKVFKMNYKISNTFEKPKVELVPRLEN